MTKSPHSDTSPRILSFVKILAAVFAVKLVLIGLVVGGVPLPEWLGFGGADAEKPVAASADAPAAPASDGSASVASADRAAQEAPAASAEAAKPSAAARGPEPQGREAALLAAEAKPAPRRPRNGVIEMPTPGGEPAVRPAISAERSGPKIPTVMAVSDGGADAEAASGGWLDLLSLSELPVPLLGSAAAAHAAAADLPVPMVRTAPQNSFSPADQQKPRGFDANVLGAQDPAAAQAAGTPGVPEGMSASVKTDAPLPARGDAGGMPPLPAGIVGPKKTMPSPKVGPGSGLESPSTRAQELARQQQDMLMLRQQMDQRLQDMEGAENRMQDLIREARALEDKKMRSLILMYSNMKPKIAAKALESMDDRVAIRILSGMPPKQAGEILTYTDPEKTAALSELITRMKTLD